MSSIETTVDWKRFRVDFVWLALFGLVIRGAGLLAMGKGLEPSLWEYEEIAQNLLHRGEFVLSYRDYGDYYALVAPAYSYLAYAVYSLFGTSHHLMQLIQFVLALLLAVSLYLLSWSLFRCQVQAFLTAALVLAHPGIAVYGVSKLHNFNLYVPLYYLSLALAVHCHQRGTARGYLWLGLAGGLAVLSRATVLPILLVWLVLLLGFGRGANRLRGTLVAGLLIVLVNVPWTVRNTHQFGRVIFSQSNGWEQFWVGNNLNATGTHYTQDGRLILSLKPESMKEELRASTSELDDSAIFKQYTLSYVRENPGHFLAGLFSKGWRFWWFHPQTGLHYPRLALIAYKLVYVGILVLTLMGLRICHQRKLWRVEMLYPLALLLGMWGLHTLAFGEMRHRWAVEPVLLLFAAHALAELLRRDFPRLYSWMFSAQKVQGSALPVGEEA